MRLHTLFGIALLGSALALPAAATLVVYNTSLSGAAESPSNASLGTGTALITVDTALNTMHVEVTFSGLTGNVTASHIHCCTAIPGVGTAGVATTTPTFTGFPSGTTSGTYDHLFDMTLASSYNPAFITAQGGLTNAMTALFAGFAAGTTYLNIHTTAVPSGEIRGFLHVVPEPGTYALILAGLASLAFTARRRVIR
jgi:CHRD domain/PEP-CTERM motif